MDCAVYRFYQPDYDVLQLKVVHDAAYSEAAEIRFAVVVDCDCVRTTQSFAAATTGVQSATEVIKYLLAGPMWTMTASALYRMVFHTFATMEKSLLRGWKV